MNPPAMPRPTDVMPHAHDAVLLDQVTRVDANRLQARLVVRPGTAFSDPTGDLPAWVGPEIMAQAIAALAGCRSLAARGERAAIGLLLGVRAYEAASGDFRSGESLQVDVVESSVDEEGWAVFDGKIRRAGAVVASGTLTVFQPPDDSFLDRERARDD